MANTAADSPTHLVPTMSHNRVIGPDPSDPFRLASPFSGTRAVIARLQLSFPDKHPRKKVTEYDLGYQAGAIEVIRRLKEETGYD